MKRIIFIIGFVIVLLVLLFFSIYYFNNRGEEAYMKMAIYPTGTIDETYYFVLKNNSEFIFSAGTRNNDNINSKKFMKSIKDSKEIQIDTQDSKYISELLKTLKETYLDNDRQQMLDSWHVLLLYDGKVYEGDYWQNNSEAFQKLIEKIINLSPISIDLHDWT
jgi:hypothetical protein